MHVQDSLATSGNANQGSFMDVLLAGNHNLLVRSQSTLDLDLVANQVSNLNAARKYPLPAGIVDVDQGNAAQIASNGDGRNRQYIDDGRIVNSGFTDHA